MSSLKLAGKSYPLKRFRARDRVRVEKLASDAAGTQRNVSQMARDGQMSEHALLVAGVIQLKELDADAVLDLFDEHVDGGGDIYSDCVVHAYLHMAESGVLGKVDVDKLRKLFFGDEEEGKEAAPLRAVPAAQ